MKRHEARRGSVASAVGPALVLLSLCFVPAGPIGATAAALLCTGAYAIGKRRDLSSLWALLPGALAVVWLEVAVTEVAVRLA